MALPPEIEAQILRVHHAERWPIGTIATQLSLHRDSVARVLAQAGLPALSVIRRPSAIDPYLPFILETLTQFPRLRASRLYAMVKDRGYPGRPDHFRHLIARHRPRPKHEAFLRLATLPGEQMQIDWGHFGHLEIGRARRPLMAFVAVLSWSRQIFLRFYLGAHMENFLRGRVAAVNAWGGCPRVALYDNLKSAVLERQGNVIRFHPTLLATRRGGSNAPSVTSATPSSPAEPLPIWMTSTRRPRRGCRGRRANVAARKMKHFP